MSPFLSPFCLATTNRLASSAVMSKGLIPAITMDASYIFYILLQQRRISVILFDSRPSNCAHHHDKIFNKLLLLRTYFYIVPSKSVCVLIENITNLISQKLMLSILLLCCCFPLLFPQSASFPNNRSWKRWVVEMGILTIAHLTIARRGRRG